MARLPITQRMMILSIATAVVTIALKTIAWRLSGSEGLFSDAVESLVNLAAAVAALVAVRVAAAPPDDEHAFGHGKAEYFASGLEGALIGVAAVTIVVSAVRRLLHPAPIESLGAGLLLSVLASAANGAVGLALVRIGKREDSIALEADGRHLLTDVVTSIGVVTALLLLFVFPRLTWLDPVVAIGVALHILGTGYTLVRRSLDGLMDVSLPQSERSSIDAAIACVLPAGAKIANLRTRKAGGDRFVVFDLRVPETMTVGESHRLCDALEVAIGDALPRTDVRIHVEPG